MYDDAFLARLKAREPAAQRQLYRAELAAVRRACARLVDEAALAEQTAGDVLDDFLFVHVDTIQHGAAIRGHLRGWVRTHCRRARRIQAQLALPTGELETTTEPRLELPRRFADLHHAVESLPPQQRRALRLQFFHGQKPSEIATELGVSRPRVTQLLQRALQHLRSQLGEE